MAQRTALSDDDLKAEVASLERQGHRRLLVLTGEHPKYTFDQFLHVSTECVGGGAEVGKVGLLVGGRCGGQQVQRRGRGGVRRVCQQARGRGVCVW